MKILKHGQQLYGFVCDMCGCVWKAVEKETESGVMNCPECTYRTRGSIMYPEYIVVPLSIKDQTILKRIENNKVSEKMSKESAIT